MSTQCLPGGFFRCKKTISRMRHPDVVDMIRSCDPGTFISVTVVDIPLTLVPIPKPYNGTVVTVQDSGDMTFRETR